MSSETLPLTISSEVTARPLSRFRLGYRPWLDGLRGLAILSVMAYHAELFPRGHAGVDLFFVISGFLITLLLFEEKSRTGSMSLRRFYARRALRLFPALALMLLVSALLMTFSPEVGQNYRSLAYSAFYVTNWVVAFDLDHLSSTLYITWSLAIEEQFYFLWPISLAALFTLARRRFVIIGGLLGLLFSVCLWRVFLISQGVALIRLGQGSDTRSDGLIVGCLLAALVSFRLIPSIKLIRAGLAILALVFTAYVFEIIGSFGIGLTLINMFYAALILLLIVEPPAFCRAVLESALLTWIGRISYGLYLWHLIGYYAAEKLINNRGPQVVASTVFAFALAAISYYLVERPFLLFKNRFAASSYASVADKANSC